MQCVNWTSTLLAIKQHQVLDRLLPLPKHVDDVLRKLATQEGSDRRDLAAQVLQEAAEKFCSKGVRGEKVQFVLLCGHHREQLQLLWVV